jgi:hypothetical protein
VQISKVSESDGLLKNISITGCCVECTGIVDVKPAAQYQLVVKPEKESHIGTFDLQVDCKWVRNDGHGTELGFGIIASPKGKQFQYYVDYLAYRHL